MVKKTIRDKKGWVTFTFFPTETIETVVISGEWNDWIDEPMKMKKNGEYFITKILNVGYIYQFGYKKLSGWPSLSFPKKLDQGRRPHFDFFPALKKDWAFATGFVEKDPKG